MSFFHSADRRVAVGAALLLAAASLTGVFARAAIAAGPVDFNRDIRPILADKCYMCHGPDKNKREADLRLDTRDGLFRKGDSGANVVPRKPGESQLLTRVTTTDASERMPPPDSGKELSPAEIATLRRWIEEGAVWEGHWAFQPIKRPAPPKSVEGRVANDIDAFILDELKPLGLKQSPAADRVTLIRRLSFDLTGLPPTAAEVERFVADNSPQAYEQLVDRMLESPHYGERLAMSWLDLVRYADTVGYHGDQPVSVHPFREYVIKSFNSNKRFDQFTIEQLAGDLLPEPTLEQRIASGYNRLGMMSAEGGVQDKEYLAKYIAERVRNLSGAWLGVTLGCCECHNHKYDPFTARDFYSLEAFFADIKEQGLYSGSHASGVWGPNIKVPSPEQTQQLAALDQRLAALKQKLDTPTPELAAAQLEWEKTQVAWTLLKPALSPQATEGVKLTVKDDGSILAGGPNAKTTTYTVVIAEPPPGITALRVEVLPDDSLPKKGPGRAGNGNFVLTEFKAQLKPAGDGAAQSLALQNASATYEQTGASNGNPYGKWAVAAAIDGDAKGAGWGWAVMEKVGQAQNAVFETTGELPGGPGSLLTLTLDQLHENPTHTIGRFRLWATTSARPVRADLGASPAIAAILATPRDQRSAAQNDELAKHFRTIAPALEPLRAELKKLEQDRASLDAQIPTTLVTVSVPPRTIRILARGNWMDETGEIVQPGFPAVLTTGGSTSATATAPAVSASPGTGAAPGAPAAPARLTRLDLARWVVSPENPLTARTFVNRVWKLYFGAGLSRKLDDLGAQGEWPSHPLLLDYLAGRFVDSGWDVKQLVKTIVMSETYRQSSDEPAALREVDPFNKLLARQSRYRLDAELVRDNALRVSGLLVERVGGASVKPYQPPGYWAYLNFPQREWQNGAGDELYRRGLYTHWQRQYLHPSLLAFDAPCREECAADRPRSNTPLQSLVLLNDPTYVEAARALAVRVLKEGGDSSEKRLEWLFRRALSRSIRTAERTVLDKLLASHLADYRADAAAAKELLTVGAYAAPAELDPTELAAWTSVCRAVLSVHEFITRY